MLKKSQRVKPEYRVNITAGVSAQGRGQPPILDEIRPATRIGITGSLNSRTIVKEIKVNISITLKLFINSDTAYIVNGSIIIIKSLFPFDAFSSLSPKIFNKPLFSKILENNPNTRINNTISKGNDLKAVTEE